jgi:hypothetical protein
MTISLPYALGWKGPCAFIGTRKKEEEGRRKKEEGRRKKGEGR